MAEIARSTDVVESSGSMSSVDSTLLIDVALGGQTVQITDSERKVVASTATGTGLNAGESVEVSGQGGEPVGDAAPLQPIDNDGIATTQSEVMVGDAEFNIAVSSSRESAGRRCRPESPRPVPETRWLGGGRGLTVRWCPVRPAAARRRATPIIRHDRYLIEARPPGPAGR